MPKRKIVVTQPQRSSEVPFFTSTSICQTSYSTSRCQPLHWILRSRLTSSGDAVTTSLTRHLPAARYFVLRFLRSCCTPFTAIQNADKSSFVQVNDIASGFVPDSGSYDGKTLLALADFQMLNHESAGDIEDEDCDSLSVIKLANVSGPRHGQRDANFVS